MAEVDPHDLFGDLVMISLTSASEVGRNIANMFPLNIVSVSMEILHILFGQSEMILFLMIVVFQITGLLIKFLINFQGLCRFFSTFFYLCGIDTLLEY